MAIRSDQSLDLTPTTGAPAVMGGSSSGPAQTGPAGTSMFLLEGDRVVVRGTERAGISGVWIDGVPVLGDISSDAGACSSVIVTPALLRRETVGSRGVVLETTLALPALPLAAVQWRPPDGGLELEELRLTLHIFPGAEAVTYRTDGCRLHARDVPGGRSVELHLYPTTATWRIEGHGDSGALATGHSGSPGEVTLLVGAGDDRARKACFASAPHLGSHEIRAGRNADPSDSELLTLRTGVREIDEGWAWAIARLRHAARRAPDGVPSAATAAGAFWTGIGAVAVGEADVATRSLRLLEQAGDMDVNLYTGAPAPARALATLLAARIAAGAGHTSGALERLSDLSTGYVARLRAACGNETWEYWRLALRELADALRFSVSEEDLERLRAAVSQPAGAGTIRLPMAGRHAGTEGASGTLRWLFDPASRLTDPPRPVPEGLLHPWSTLHRGWADEGWTMWRRALAEGIEGGPAGRGSWDAEDDRPGAARPGAGLLLAGMVHGVMGAHFDAPTGRLELAPSLPGHISSFAADHIPAGDGHIDLAYQRTPRAHRFVLTPGRCRVPPTVVFRPALGVGPEAVVRIDGEPADLETAGSGTRTRFQVQLALDATRVLEVEGTADDEGPGGSSPPGPSVP